MNERVVEPAGSALIAYEHARLPITPQFASKLGVTAGEWRVLIDQIFPTAKTIEAVVMAVSYCKSRNLDIMKKPVHIVPMWSSVLNRMVETVWPSIAEIRITASRTGLYAGIDAVEFGPMIERTFNGTLDQWVEPESGGRKVKQSTKVDKVVRFPEYASVIVYKIVGGQRCAYHAKVYWEETYATIGKTDIPNEMWAKRPRGQLDKCVEAAALRKAFPEELGNTYAAEEMEGRTIDLASDSYRRNSVAPSAPNPDDEVAHDADTGEIVDVEHEEIVEGGAPDPDDHGDEVDHVDGAPDPDAGDDEPASPRQSVLDKLSDDLAAAKTPDDVQKVWLAADLDAKWGDGDADHKADLRIARGMMNGRDRALQKTAKK